MLSATVYLGAPIITELRWSHEGREWRAFTNFDARIAAHVGQVESADTVFSVLASIGAAELDDPGRPKNLPFAEGERASWLIDATAEDIAAHPSALEGIGAWIAHYNSHRPQIILEHARLAAEAAAQERERLSQPKKPAELVIRYWKKTETDKPAAAPSAPSATDTQR